MQCCGPAGPQVRACSPTQHASSPLPSCPMSPTAPSICVSRLLRTTLGAAAHVPQAVSIFFFFIAQTYMCLVSVWSDGPDLRGS